MRILPIAMLGLCLGAAGCETIDDGGDGYLTHSEHRLTASERSAVESRMASHVKVPVTLSGLKSSYRLSTGTVAVCGYVSGLSGGKWTSPTVFGGTLAAGRFTPFNAPGQGKDPQRIAAVRAYCQAEQISI